MAQNNIKLGVKLDTADLQKNLQSEINKISSSTNIKLNIDKNGFNLNDISSQIDKLASKLKNGLNLDGLTKSAYSSAQVFNQELNTLSETIGRLHEKSDLKITTANGLQEAKEVNKALEEQYKLQQQINVSKEKMQTSLTSLTSNKFIDTSVISSLQSKLNSINTDTPEKEIKELENAIKNLESSEPKIVRLQNAITKFESNLSNVKSKMNEGSLLSSDKTDISIKNYENSLNSLKSTMDKLKNGSSINGAKISSEINNITNSSKDLNSTLQQGSTHVETFGSKMKNAFSNMGIYLSAYQGIRMTINAIKDGVQTVTDIDTKMRDLKRVADDTSADDLNQFPEIANKTAISLGQTTENVIEATTTWKQLGYSFRDSSEELSKWSMVLSNVGDISAKESANDLVSVLKAFKLEAEDVGTVVDSLNEAGNKFSITTGDLAEGLRTGGAALAITNNDLYQSEALITTGVEVLRDPDTVSNGLKTIAMNLQAVKTANGDTFYKLQKDLKEMANVDLTDTNGELRSTYDIILGLSQNWDNLDEMQQSSLLQNIAGKQQARVLASIIQNASQLPKIYETLKNSAGSANEEQERYMDSIEAKANALKESVKSLWIQMISSDLIKEVLTNLTNIVQWIGSIDSGTIKLIGTITLLGVSLKSIGTFMNALKGVNALSELGKGSGLIGTTVGGFTSLGSAIKTATTASLAFSTTGLGASLIAISVACGSAYVAYDSYQSLLDKPIASTSTEDLTSMEKVINSLTGNVIKSKKQLQDAGLAYEDFSDDLSDGFKESVEEASQSFNKLNMTLNFSNLKGKMIDDSIAGEIKEQINNIVDTAKQSILNKRSDMQDTLSQLFSTDGVLDENENSVMDALSNYESEKFNTVQNLNQNIYDTLNKAIEEHRQLTEEDISNIKNWTQQVQMLKIQADAENEADEKYSSNESKFKKRLNSMTPDEALSETKTAYNEIINIGQESEDEQIKIINKASSLKDELQQAYNEAYANGDSEKANGIAKNIKTMEESITNAQDKLNGEVKTRQEETQKLWEDFYNANPQLQGKINEITFSEFTDGDYKAQDKLKEMQSSMSELATVTESGMNRIQDASGNWHDVQVEVDEATGNITSAYDLTTGKFGGYSEEFAEKTEAMYKSVYDSQTKLKALLGSGQRFNLTLDGDNNLTDELGNAIQPMEKVLALAKDCKLAIADINGQKIKLEFDENGKLTNAKEVLDTINGKDSKAKIDIDVNDQEALDKLVETENKVQSINGTYAKIDTTVNTDDSDAQLEGLKKELDGLPLDTPIDIVINGEQISTVDEARNKIEDLDGKSANVDVNANDNASDNVHNAKESYENYENLPSESTKTVNVEDKASGVLESISNWWNNLMNSDNIVTKTIKFTQTVFGGGTKEGDGYATGTNNATKGYHDTAEDGFEILVNKKKRWFNGGEQVLNHKDSVEVLNDLMKGKEVENDQDNSASSIQAIPLVSDTQETIQVNPPNIYQNKDTTSDDFSVDTSNTLDSEYKSDYVDTSNMSKEEKKAYDVKKKASEEEEKALKDKISKEKEYLSDIKDKWEKNQNQITDAISNIEIKEEEYGDNITISQKMDLLNGKYSSQLELLGEAKKQLNTYANATVTTAEAQEELETKMQSANETVLKQKKAVAEAYNEMKDYALDAIKEMLEKQQELEQLALEATQQAQKNQLSKSSYNFSESEFNNYKKSIKKGLKDDISDLEDMLEDETDLANIQVIKDGILDKQLQLNDLEKQSYDNISDLADVYEKLHTERSNAIQSQIDDLDEELEALEEENEAEERSNTLLEKKNTLKQAELDLERLKNQKTVYSYEKQEDGTYQFKWTVDQSAIDEAQQAVDDAKDDYNDTKDSYKLEDEKAEIEARKKTLQKQLELEENLVSTKNDLYNKDLANLESAQEKATNALENKYKDMDTLSQEWLENFQNTYGTGWNTIATAITTSTDSISQSLEKLTDIKATEGIEGLVDIVDQSGLLDIKLEDVQEKVKINSDGLNEILTNTLNNNQSIKDSNNNLATDLLTIQNTSQNNQLSSYKDFASVYSIFSDKFLGLVQAITDFRFSNMTNIAETSLSYIMQALVQAEEAYNEFVDMMNEMNINNEDWSDMSYKDTSSLQDEFDKYKEDVLSWYSEKAELYNKENNPLYNADALASYIDGTNSLLNRNIDLSSLGNTNTNNIGGTTYKIDVSNVSLPNVKSGEDFINQMFTYAQQKTNNGK